MKNWTKSNNETTEDYIRRVCSYKNDERLTWCEIADIINENTGLSFSESYYRKKYTAPSPLSFVSQEEVNRQKLYSTKLEMQRIVRQQSRFELFYETIRQAIQDKIPEWDPAHTIHPVRSVGNEHILTIADIHCGACFNLPGNQYSIQVCEDRIIQLYHAVSGYVKDHNLTHMKVVELGDSITGLLRIKDLQLNETSVVQATVSVAQMLVRFLNRLSYDCAIDFYQVPSANHSQTRPISSKPNELAAEDLEYIIGNYIRDMLSHNKNITVHTNFGCDYIQIPVYDFNVIATHGHTIKSLDTALKDYSAIFQKMVDYLIVGHFHRHQIIPGNAADGHDSEVILCPSFQGTDPYSYNTLKKTSKAACMMLEFDPYFGRVGSHKFILN